MPKTETAVLGDPRELWLVGAGGMYWSRDAVTWSHNEEYRFRVTSLLRQEERVRIGTNCGVWEVCDGSSRWIQLNDETVTEVLDVAPVSGDPGAVVATAYGVATGGRDELGAVRWTERIADLAVPERYTNAIAVDPVDPDRWLVGTEAGVLVTENGGERWIRTGLMGSPVRVIAHHVGRWWAGTDGRGVWQSTDGLSWHRAGRGLDEGTVVCLAETNGSIVAGTAEGVVRGDGAGHWHRSGPRALVAAVAVHPVATECWMIGAVPGGGWITTSGGDRWRYIPELPSSVEAIVAPEGRDE